MTRAARAARSALACALLLGTAACGEDGAADSTGNGGAATGGTGGSNTGGAAGSSSGGAGAGGAAGNAGSGGGGTGGTGGSNTGGAPSCAATLPTPDVVDVATTPPMTIIGNPPAALGIFDASIEYPVSAPGGAMAYSAVVAKNDISTRIAVSPDAGATWTWVASPNQAADLSVPCAKGTCTGRLIHEVPSLVFDADDPDTTRRWKLFAHSYLVETDGTHDRQIGHLALWTAPEPLGPWKSEGPSIGWTGESELSSKDVPTIVNGFAGMGDCAALTEPGALWRQGGILDLAVGCASVTPSLTIRIELLRSLDHGKTFGYAGRLLEATDGPCVGGTRPEINAADLFVAQGKSYLVATPVQPLTGGFEDYRGCFVFPLGTGGKGVQRDTSGAPIVTRVLEPADGRFSGACTAAEGATTVGYVMSQLHPEASVQFRLYGSGVGVP